MQRKLVFLLLVLMTGFVVSAAAQQQSFNRYDLFVGYSHLSSPAVSLEQNGVNGSFGVNVNRWLALGADFSIFTGPGTIELADTKVAGLLAPHLPAGANPKVPFDAKTYTFAAGPQINIRRFEKVTFFLRPGLGILHEKAEPTISPALAPLAPLVPGLSANMTDTVPFYGFGGGFDWNMSEHVGMRFSVDFVHTTLFKDLLSGRNAVRISFSPTWRWGKAQ